jgi:protein phosphatase
MPERPPHLPPGTPLGDHFTVEGLVRLSEGRMFYLAHDARPDLDRRRCWSCGHPSTPRGNPVCERCGAPMRDRRFLISAHWESDVFDAFEAFHRLGVDHPGIIAPIDVFRQGGVLYSVVPYGGEGLMIDEAAPLSNERLLYIAQRVLGMLAWLHRRGVRMRWLNRANLLVAPDGTVRFFDPEVDQVLPGPVPPEQQVEVLRSAGEMLRRYCNIEADGLAELLGTLENGESPGLTAFGRRLEALHDDWAARSYSPWDAAMSDVGLTRQLNEDNWGWLRLSERARLYVVADGMGGHDGGEVASAMAVQTICRVARERESAPPQGDDAVEEMLDTAFQSANNTVKENAEAKGTDMGTTLVSCLIVDNRVGFMANVGDSRGYLLRDSSLHQVSRDHSLVQKMVERGRLTADEARNHPHSNILLRTVGTERDVEIDIFRVELAPGDRLLMCSDGLWGEVEDRDIESILNTYTDPRIAARELIRAAHHGGGKDNVTLLIVTIPTAA